MNPRRVGGSAAIADPRFVRLAALGLALLTWSLPASGQDWIPPRHVTAVLPGATLAPSSSTTIDLTLLASGGVADLDWMASAAGQFACGIMPLSGAISVPSGGTATVPLTVSLPDTAQGICVLTVVLTNTQGGTRAAKATALITAATGGRPEIKPVPGTWLAPAGTSGSVTFQVHSLIGGSEEITLTTGRSNPDPNNGGALFAGSAASTPVVLSGGGTIVVSAPTTIPSNAYAGNLNQVQVSVTSGGGISSGTGHAVASAPGSVPTALVPAGLTAHDDAITGRDGAALLAARGYWLVPVGPSGVRVHRVAASDTIGVVDAAGDGVEDRWIGTLATPPFTAAVDVIPGFVTAAGETLDVGLMAAGRGGLILFDLRSIEDPLFGTWEDFYDADRNGIDDRILRTIPLSGFATDVGWFRTPTGRVVALVADADTGSVPVAVDYNPALVTPGSGQGVVAVDVGAALDTVGMPPYLAGTLPTPGSALDLELRGGSSPDLVVANGASGLTVYGITASGGVPATVTFTLRGTVPLSSAWGTPHARDVAWVSNTKDSTYAAVAAGAGGLQIVRLPQPGAGPPQLVLSQQTAGPAIGVTGTWTGTCAVALGTSGAALFGLPGSSYLNQIAPGAPAPYTAPVVLARGAAWGATGSALEVAAHQSWISSATSLHFEGTAGPIPDLLVSDGGRVLLLRPGTATITAVEGPTREAGPPTDLSGRILSVSPNPAGGEARLRLFLRGPARRGVVARLIQPSGRLVREFRFAALPEGESHLDLDLRGLGRGIYFLQAWKTEGAKLGNAAKVIKLD